MELSWFQRTFPGIALRRMQNQTRIMAQSAAQKRYYDSAVQDSYRLPLGADVSPQGLNQHGAKNIRRNARNLDENNDIAISILDTLVNNIIGCGLPLQPLIKNMDGSLNLEANERMAQIVAQWGKKPTACGTQSLANTERLLVRTWLRDGEVLINKIKGSGFDHNGELPYTLELMESDFLPYELNETRPRLIIQGVECNQYYKPIRYMIAKHHPGDIWNAAPQVFTNESDYRPIPAENMIHLKFTRRINQVRGISLLHGVINKISDIGDFINSEQIAARVASAFTGYIKKSPDAVTNINQDTGNRDLEMSPGMIFSDLLPGEEIGSINSNRPNTEVVSFKDGLMRGVASAAMVNYSTINRDYNGSYSSQRQGMVEAKPNYDTLREYFVSQFMQPVYEDLVDIAIASGLLQLDSSVDDESLHHAGWAATPIGWVDPKKEIEGDLLRISGGLASKSQVISERGGIPAVVARQRENDLILFGPDEVPPNEQESTEQEDSAPDNEQENAA